jgi:DNA polymerase-3 subunit delta'
MFNKIKGHSQVIKLLTNAMKNDRIAPAYLFHGPEGVGKFTTALYFGMALNCESDDTFVPCGKCNSCHRFLEFNHPDLFYIFPTPPQKKDEDGNLKSQSVNEYLAFVENRKVTPWIKYYYSGNTEIRKESTELLQKRIETSQREGNYRICIIEDAEEMNLTVANSFLKTLEEPPNQTIFILTTTKIQSILPTIVSRCQVIYFKPLSNRIIEKILTDEFLIEKQQAMSIAKMSNGNVELAFRFSQDSISEARSYLFFFLESLIKKEDNLYIESLITYKDKIKSEMVHDLLHYLTVFFNELAEYMIYNSRISHLDYSSLLIAYSQQICDWEVKIPNIIILIDELHSKIEGNVNIQYILAHLYCSLKVLSS